MSSKTIFICGGGTGGHFFSGVALAEKILDFDPESRIIFIGTRRGIEGRTTLSDPRMSIIFIAAKGLLGKGLVSKFLGALYLIWGCIQSFGILIRYRPSLVFGVGGYASAPTLFSAIILRPFLRSHVCLLEQNSYPGLSNEFLRSLGARAFSGFSIPGYEVVPLPLRRQMDAASQTCRKFAWPPRVVLVVGGSQGARGLNQKWRELISEWIKVNPHLQVLHQTGTADEASFREFYKSQNISAEVFSFSSEMNCYYDRADLVVCRSGAMTVFEVMAFERPVIFVPFPGATLDHQYRNAVSVQSSDWVIREHSLNWESVQSLVTADKPALMKKPENGLYNSWLPIFKSLDLSKSA